MAHRTILWLPSWYPNPEDTFEGDFIQRHAYAAAVENKIHVLFVKAIDQQEQQTQEVYQQNNLTEQIIYIKKEHGLLKKLLRQKEWFHQYKKAVQQYIKANGRPDLVHVHVPWRAGLIALWLKRKYNIPYIVTEHWDIYNEVVAGRFSRQPRWKRILIKRVYKEAIRVVPVSRFMAKAIDSYVVPKQHRVIHNVVDTNVFTCKPAPAEPFVFLHVSTMVPKKNVSGILQAFAIFQRSNVNVQLVLVGNRDDHYVGEAERSGIKERIFFCGEILYKEVAVEMQRAHCFIVNSVMENSPCVIGEALCCGTPVIATAVGGIPELVDSTNSILIPPGDTQALVAAMQQVHEDFKKFNRAQIARAAAKKFGMDMIAHQFAKLYESLTPPVA